MTGLLKKQVPAAQALLYTIERVLEAIDWLEENEKEWRRRYDAHQDGYKLRLHSRILADIISVYIATLVEGKGSGHSLVKSYAPHDFVKKFVALPIVKKCKLNRHNRSGHESRSYGYFVSTKEILDSDLKKWLEEVKYFLVSSREI